MDIGLKYRTIAPLENRIASLENDIASLEIRIAPLENDIASLENEQRTGYHLPKGIKTKKIVKM